MKLYRPNNFDCPVTEQNWFHMVTEHTIHPNNFKVTSHISTTLFSQIPSALSIILHFSTSCYRKGAERVTFFLHPSAKIVTLPLGPGGQKQNLGVLLQVCGGRSCQDPFKCTTTLTQASPSFRYLLRSWGSARQKLPFVLVSGPARMFSSDLFSFLSFSLLSPRMASHGTTVGKMEQLLLHSHCSPPAALSWSGRVQSPGCPSHLLVIFCWGRGWVPPWVPAADQFKLPLLMELLPLLMELLPRPGERPCRVMWSKWISSIWLVLKSKVLFALSLFLIGCLGEEGLLKSHSFSGNFYNHRVSDAARVFFPLFSLHHMVRRRGFSTSLSLSPRPWGFLWRPTLLGTGFSAISFSLFLGSPWDSAPLYLVMITVFLPVANSFFNKLFFFTYMFLLSSLLIGERGTVKTKKGSYSCWSVCPRNCLKPRHTEL